MTIDYYFKSILSNITVPKDGAYLNPECQLLAENFKHLSDTESTIFFVLHLTFCVVAVIGNFAAVVVTAKRKHRYVQKSCVISLALSDIVTAVSMSLLNITVFMQGNSLWTLGSFMCNFGPALQAFGVVCSSMSIVAIALDRYRSVIYAFKKRFNPKLLNCLLGIGLVWLVSGGVSYPMFTFYTHIPINVTDPNNNNNCKIVYLCISLQKAKLQNYYIIIICTVFMPLLLLFLWFYVKIAQLIWRHRKPVSSEESIAPKSTVNELSTSNVRVSHEYSRTTMNTSDTEVKSIKKNKDSKVKRKIRTFKIIIFLMFIFLLLRLPLWIFDTIKNSPLKISLWTVKYTCSALTILNCALNPLLYTFLNKTVEITVKFFNALKDFTCEVCCCCMSNKEFEEFEYDNSVFRNITNKNINGSVLNNSKNKVSKVKFNTNPSTNSVQDIEKAPEENEADYKF